MVHVLRSMGAVILGLVTAGVVVAVTEALSQRFVFALPEGIDPNNYDQMKAVMAGVPAQALLFILAGWTAGAFLAARLAGWAAGRSPRTHGLFVGGLFLLSAVANMVILPHPAWFWAVSLPVLFGAVGLGALHWAGPPASQSASS